MERTWSRVSSIIKHCYENVPYYTRSLREIGAEPEDFNGFDDFKNFPVLTRETLQQRRTELLSRIPSSTRYSNSTGGSTGKPVKFFQDGDYFDRSMASIDFSAWLCGYKPGDKNLFLWGSDLDSAQNSTWKMKVNKYLENSVWINMFGISKTTLYSTAERIARWKPKFIFAYTSSARLLAEVFESRRLPAMRNLAIQLTAETVTPEDRLFIESRLGGRIFNRYGSREVSIIAHECPIHEGLHVIVPNNYLEFGEPVKGTAFYPILVTNITNLTMPLLKYEIGDLGKPFNGNPCSCGGGFPKIEHVSGRISDVVVTPSGRLFHGEYFTHLFYGIDGIRRFQVEQISIEDIVVKIEPAGMEFDHSAITGIRNRILGEVDSSLRIRFEITDSIPHGPSGKHRYTISKVTREPGSILV